MANFGLRAMCGFVAAVSCACGSGNLTFGLVDAGVDVELPDASPPTTVTTTCGNSDLLAGCTAGGCVVSAPTMPLPTGESIVLTQQPAAADLAGDTLGNVVCTIALPMDVQSVQNLDLRIALSPAPDTSATLFQYVSPVLSRVVLTSQATGVGVEGLVTAPGTFGATERPGLFTLTGALGLNQSSAADQASLLRNLSAQPMSNAFYDGTHLFVCNGPRLLVYSGIPASPATAPALVIGQADIDTLGSTTSSSLFGRFGCAAPWSDGTRLVVANQNRVLVWNQIPTSPLTPADLVLGQSDFVSNGVNGGGSVGPQTLNGVQSIDSDGTRLAVADTGNNRILLWGTFPAVVGQPPDFVVGEPDFTTNAANAGAAPLSQAWGVTFQAQGMYVSSLLSSGVAHIPPVTTNNPQADFLALPPGYLLYPATSISSAANLARTPGGGLAVRDANMQRVAMFRTAPTMAAPIDFAIGQPDPVHVVENPVSASSLSAGLQLGAGQEFLVPDANRLLVFDTPPSYDFEPASRVIGQAGFTTSGQVDYRGISASTLAGPSDVAVAGGLVAVADRSNNRVLLFHAADLASPNATAAVVLGQPDAQSYVPNLDQRTPSNARMSGPSGVALDGTHLVVADTENHRVLIWNTVPTATGAPANLELGQADFSGRRPNRGRGDANLDGLSDAAADGFFYPTGVASDGTRLFVVDRLNNRILVWNTFPTTSGQSADAVIGQASLTASGPNAGNGPFVFVPNGLNLPTGVTLAGNDLWVADSANNRVVRLDATTFAPVAFLGQTSGSSVPNAHYFLSTEVAVGQPRGPVTTNAGTVVNPRAVAVAGSVVYVSESDSNRVHMFDATALTPLGELGQAADGNGDPNINGVTAASLSGPLGVAAAAGTLWVADANNNRVVGYPIATAPATGARATMVVGQSAFVTNGFDQTSAAASGVTAAPSGVALAGGNLYVADTNNNRVLVVAAPQGTSTGKVYGQPNSTLALANAGGAPSASSLKAPKGVYADATRVIIADTGNNRVLVYDPAATGNAASLVLGQAGFTTNSPNLGGPSASTMQSPTSAYSDGTSLWVADTGNHRVLVWKTFPTASGQPADLVLGQMSFTAVLPNLGFAGASQGSLAFPWGITVVGGVLYVADSGNNRVVSFSTMPAANGALANGVLGQADLMSRGAAATADDVAHLAGPTALATDGENLYVVDRDLARVLSYDVGTLKSSAPALLDIGALTSVPLAAPQGIAVERTAFFTSRLYVADTGNSRVALVGSVSRLTPP